MASQLMKPSLDLKFCKEEGEKKRRLAKLDHNNEVVSGPRDKRGQGPPLTEVLERGLHPVRSRGQGFGFPKENE